MCDNFLNRTELQNERKWRYSLQTMDAKTQELGWKCWIDIEVDEKEKEKAHFYSFQEDLQRPILCCDNLMMFSGWIWRKGCQRMITNSKESCEIKDTLLRERKKGRKEKSNKSWCTRVTLPTASVCSDTHTDEHCCCSFFLWTSSTNRLVWVYAGFHRWDKRCTRTLANDKSCASQRSVCDESQAFCVSFRQAYSDSKENSPYSSFWWYGVDVPCKFEQTVRVRGV